jgi:hypothetical protein
MPSTSRLALAPEVRSAAYSALRELVPMWLAEEPRDTKRVRRRTGPGSSTVSIESYQGSLTWLGFRRRSGSLQTLSDLRQAILTHQPELLGYLVLPGLMLPIGDSNALATLWCRTASSYVQVLQSEHSAIERVLDELETTLQSGRLQQTATAVLTGLRLGADVKPIALGDGLVLRSLSDDELTDLSSHDVLDYSFTQDLPLHSVSACLVATGAVEFTLESNAPQQVTQPTFPERVRQRVSEVLSALHVAKPGRVAVYTTTYSMTPRVLPAPSGSSEWSMAQMLITPSLEFNDQDLSEFVSFYRSLLANSRDEVEISVNRLKDAETRLSPVDALLDAAIGLEVLLNPQEDTELSFRIALNYAYLGPPQDRRSRYEHLRTIQKTRNRVIHGGLNMQSPEAPTIQKHAELAKACLRRSLQAFLSDPTLAGNARLDAQFWLDRIWSLG